MGQQWHYALAVGGEVLRRYRGERGGEAREFLVRASYLEIYNEEIRDLLSKNTQNKLELKVMRTTRRAHVPRRDTPP